MSERGKHRHEFAVDAACDGCGMMISEVLISEKERADGNFGSYLRVRDLHTEARERVAELDRHQAEDAKAIRALYKALADAHDELKNHKAVGFSYFCRETVEHLLNGKTEHAAAIQRAREQT